MIRLLAVISTFSITALLLLDFLDSPKSISYFLMGAAAGTITLLLARIYAIVSILECKEDSEEIQQYIMRAHILLQLVPSSYLIIQYFTTPSLLVNVLYYVPIMLFFLTGRLTWRTLYQQYGSKMYLFFYKGNTGMLLGLTVMLVMGIFDEAFREFFPRALLVYFVIHFLLIGLTVTKIEKDFLGQ